MVTDLAFWLSLAGIYSCGTAPEFHWISQNDDMAVIIFKKTKIKKIFSFEPKMEGPSAQGPTNALRHPRYCCGIVLVSSDPQPQLTPKQTP